MLRVIGLSGVVQLHNQLGRERFQQVDIRGLHTLAALRSLRVLDLTGCVPDHQQDEPLASSLASWQPLMPGLEVLLLGSAAASSYQSHASVRHTSTCCQLHASAHRYVSLAVPKLGLDRPTWLVGAGCHARAVVAQHITSRL